MKKTESAGGIVQNVRGEIALVLHGTGEAWWGFPKGHVDKGENAEMAARREILEETGLKSTTLLKDLGSYSRYKAKVGGGDDESEYKTIHMFLFSTTEEALAPLDPAHPEARWVAPKEVAQMLSNPKDKIFWLDVLSQLS